MDKHTKAPEGKFKNIKIIDDAVVPKPEPLLSYQVRFAITVDASPTGRATIAFLPYKPHAQRIVATIEACKGLPTEALKKGIAKKLLGALKETLELFDLAADYSMLTPEQADKIKAANAITSKMEER